MRASFRHVTINVVKVRASVLTVNGVSVTYRTRERRLAITAMMIVTVSSMRGSRGAAQRIVAADLRCVPLVRGVAVQHLLYKRSNATHSMIIAMVELTKGVNALMESDRHVVAMSDYARRASRSVVRILGEIAKAKPCQEKRTVTALTTTAMVE